jgi:hypothetical protein
MTMNHSDTLFNIADELLLKAKLEMERSEEDVVTHIICNNARQSISNFLAGFLIQRKIEIEHPVTLASLLAQCISVDKKFESFDLTELHCRHDTNDRNYCLEPEQVDACIKIAHQMRSIVMSDNLS